MRRLAIVATLVLWSTVWAAEPRIEQSLISWSDIRAAEFPAPPSGTRKPKNVRTLARVTSKLASDRQPIVKEFVGRDFYGLSEIVSIRPDRSHVKTLKFTLWERQTLDEPSKIGSEFGDDDINRLHRVVVLVPVDEAKAYGVGDVVNVSGVIEGIDFEDWQDLIFGDRDRSDLIVTVVLKDAEF